MRRPGMTSRSILAACFARAFTNSLPPSPKRGRRECRVRAAPAVSCAKNCTVGAHEHTGERKHSDIPCATALRLISCSPRRSGLVVTVISGILPADLTPASRRQDHTTSPYAATAIRLWRAASIASRAPRVVTMAIRPSGGRETAQLIILIFRNEKQNIFSWGTGQPKSA